MNPCLMSRQSGDDFVSSSTYMEFDFVLSWIYMNSALYKFVYKTIRLFAKLTYDMAQRKKQASQDACK